MQLRIIIMVCSLVWTAAGVCFGQDFWKRSYAGDGITKQVIQTSDGNYLVVGQANYDAWYDGWLVKYNRNGDTLWTKTYGGPAFEELTGVCPTPDGAFLVVGRSGLTYNGWVLKIDADGDTVWTKRFPCHNFTTIIPAADGNYLCTGIYSADPNGSGQASIMKLSANGDSLWSKFYGGWMMSVMVRCGDGNYLAGGGNNGRGYLVKLTPAGDTIWSAWCGPLGRCAVTAVAPGPNGDFLVGGIESRQITGWVSKISGDGKELWTKNSYDLGLNGQITSMAPTEDGNVIASSFFSSISPIWYGKVAKINPDGAVIWDRKYADGYIPSALHQLTGGDVVVGGYDPLSNVSYSIYYLVGDRYVRRGALFTYKTPCLGADSLNYGFAPLSVPSGMTISTGGTISWTPATDSVYLEQVRYAVLDDHGRRDTLTLNLYVNCEYGKAILGIGTGNTHPSVQGRSHAITVTPTAAGSFRFSMPFGVSELQIFDVTGRLLCRLAPKVSGSGVYADWQGNASGGRRAGAGRYFARATGKAGCAVTPFLMK